MDYMDLISQAGVCGVVAYFFKIYIDKTEKERDKDREQQKEIVYIHINKLVDKIDNLITVMQDQVATQACVRTDQSNEYEKMHDLYIRMSKKIENIDEKISKLSIEK